MCLILFIYISHINLIGTPIAYNTFTKLMYLKERVIIMHNNYILKQAVLTALTMLTIGLQGQALAVGLGDIEVRSHIGQPLIAKIKVQGIEGLKDQACFRLGGDSDGINAISQANLKLGNVKGDEGILTISTVAVITEPIVSLSVIAECDTSFRRDYVLLIDPLLTTEIDQTAEEEATSTVEIADNSVEKSAVAESQSVKKNTGNTNSNKKRAAKKQAAANKNNDNIVLTVNYDGKQTVNAANKTNVELKNTAVKNTPKESKPRLSISGGSYDGNANMIGLRLDKQLHFSAETAPQALASNVAIEDEATVLSNRLAHLEQQITTLQQRNSFLEAEKNQQAPQAEAVVKSNLSTTDTTWWPYLAGAGLLLAGYFAADFWRRRRQSQQLDNAEDVWNVLDANSNNVVYYKDTDLDDTLFENKTQSESKPSTEQSLSATDFEATQVVEIPFQVEEDIFEHNILDHADVFLSHGRTSLALQLLQNHLLDYPKQSVTIWLFLLDLLAKENLQAVYEQTALECKEHFNIRIAGFSNDEASPKQNLEDFPRLTAGLEQAWGTPAALVYLDDLIYNSRLETRVGFEKSVLEELVLLRSIAQNNVNKADVIQLDEKKMAIKELKDAKLAASKADKLQKLEELTLVEAAKADATAAEAREELFEFNLIEYK